MKLKIVFLALSLTLFLAACAQNGQVLVTQNSDTSNSSNQGIRIGEPNGGQVNDAENSDHATSDNTQENSQTPAPNPPSMTPESNTTFDQLAKPQKGDTIATIETDFGTMKMKIFEKEVPELSKNFIELAKAGKYTNVPFHRVIKDFMIQTGDFTNKDGTGGYSYKGPDQYLPNEINPALKHLFGTVSMAKTPAPVSIGSQFFIVTNKNGTSFLDGGYSPFGQVYEGMDVALKIADLHNGDQAGTPTKIVNIKKVTISTY